MRSLLAVAAMSAALSACLHAAGRLTTDDAGLAVAAVERTEAAFARRVDEVGVVPAFREYVGPEAIMFMPEPVVINPRLPTENWPGTVDWHPRFAVAAGEGDLVATAGPSLWTTSRGAYPGYYFTVWVRQGDGGYKFVLDGSASIPVSLYEAAGQSIRLDGETPGAPRDWRHLEEDFATEASADTQRAFSRHFDPRVLVLRENAEPALGATAGSRRVTADPSRLNFVASGGGGSARGDIVWAYGLASWREGEAERRATFTRVWRFDGARYVIAIDQLTPLPLE